MKVTLLGVFALTVVLLSSCSKTTTAPTNYSSYFPQTVGDSWLYSIRDSIRDIHDTALVTIAGTTTVSGQNAYLWTYHYHSKGYYDTTYVVVNGTNITVYLDTAHSISSPAYVVYEQYSLPMSVGQIIKSNGDSTNVIAQGNCTVVAGSYPGSYEITNLTYNPGYYVYDKVVFFNNIGFLSDFHNSAVYNNFLENGNWYLLSYVRK